MGRKININVPQQVFEKFKGESGTIMIQRAKPKNNYLTPRQIAHLV